MRKGIHPEYKELKVRIGKDVITTMSTYAGSEFLAEIDYRNHPAWKGGANTILLENDNVSKFKDKFPGLFSKK
ncbi:MAG: 50S ribosomal protein L31 [Rickettsiaceae bacterium]